MSGYNGIPDKVSEYARGTRNGAQVVEAWQLHSRGGLNARQVADRVDVHYRTVTRWLSDLRRLVEGEPDGEGTSTPLGLATMTADDVARERAWLYKQAKADGKWDVAQRALDSEQRRLGLDVQRIEQTSLQVQLQAMAPEQQRAELQARLTRLAQRGHLSLPTGDAPTDDEHDAAQHDARNASHDDEHAGAPLIDAGRHPGAPPALGDGAPGYDPPDKSTTSQEHEVNASEEGSDGSGDSGS